jgi:predicted TIM-barrel fold metal-dependent hydrolase
MGETLPFMLTRLDRGLSKELTKLKRPVGDYLTQNFLDLFFQVGVERIIFSADYPYSSMIEANISWIISLKVLKIKKELHMVMQNVFLNCKNIKKK